MGFSSNLRRFPGVLGVSTSQQAEEQCEAFFQCEKKFFNRVFFTYNAPDRTQVDEAIDYLTMCSLKSWGRKSLRSIPVLREVSLTPLIPVLEDFIRYLGTFGNNMKSGIIDLVLCVANHGKVILSALKSDNASFDAADFFKFSFLADLLLNTAIDSGYQSGKFLNVNCEADLVAVSSANRPLIISSQVSQSAVDSFLERFPRARISYDGSFAPLFKYRAEQGLFFGACRLPPCEQTLPFKFGLIRSMVYGEELPRPIVVQCIITLLKSDVVEDEPVEAVTVYLNQHLKRGVIEGTEDIFSRLIPLIEKSGIAPADITSRIPSPAKQTLFKAYFRNLRRDFKINPLLILIDAARKFVSTELPITPQPVLSKTEVPKVVEQPEPAPEEIIPEKQDATEPNPVDPKKKKQRKKKSKKTSVSQDVVPEIDAKSSVSQTSNEVDLALSIQAKIFTTLIDSGVITPGHVQSMKDNNSSAGNSRNTPKWHNQPRGNPRGNGRGGGRRPRNHKQSARPPHTERVVAKKDLISELTEFSARQ